MAKLTTDVTHEPARGGPKQTLPVLETEQYPDWPLRKPDDDPGKALEIQPEKEVE
ncbi:2140_t:CDS:2 [Paraglomus occultum]|uniref:2140_t:CDS:1 n=1 Tax=Paraglomus occultum TaxID=144539 RepID=A0A9N9FU44_9GLOM|nr:2140_t:CDS:2 [Paraglomus occultum]